MRARIAVVLLCTAALVVSCASILEIEDPIVRPPDAGRDTGTPIDSATIDTSTDTTTPSTVKRVFVTKQKFTADLTVLGQATSGGAAADTLCTNAAVAANLGGVWQAWIRDGDSVVEANDMRGTGPWFLVDRTTRIFESQLKLRGPTATPEAPLDMDETGGRVSSADRVWTGSKKTCSLCLGWSSKTADLGASYGQVGSVTNAWTDAGCAPCAGEAHLYCFEE